MKCDVNGNLRSDLRAQKYTFCGSYGEAESLLDEKEIFHSIIFDVAFIEYTSSLHIRVYLLSTTFGSFPGPSGMLARILTKTPQPCTDKLSSVLSRHWGNKWGRMTEGSGVLSWLVLFSWSVDIIWPQKTHQLFFQVSVSSSAKWESIVPGTHEDWWDVCLLMVLRILGTYKYFPRIAGIFPLAIRLEEVCSISSVHL